MKRVVLGIDIGTTHLKVGVYDLAGLLIARQAQKIEMLTPSQGMYEQDPELVYAILLGLLTHLRSEYEVLAIGFSVAMHSFIALDAKNTPLTKSWTWMDQRSDSVMDSLSSQVRKQQKDATGTPIHSMSPWLKWLWLKQAANRSVDRPVGLKEYLLYRLTGKWVTDYSTAAATGFLNQATLQWDEAALRIAELDADHLPVLQEMRDVIPWQGIPLVLGGSDGAMAHVGLGVTAGQGVLSLGTSGALRITADTLPKQVPNSLFAYSMGTDQGYLVGAALSNVGNLLQWLAKVWGMDVVDLLNESLQNPILADLPLFLPYLFGSRFPYWRLHLPTGYMNLQATHTDRSLKQAVIVAIVATIRQAMDVLESSVGNIQIIFGASGLLGNAYLSQEIVNALQKPIAFIPNEDASVYGGARLAAAAIGYVWPTLRHVSLIEPKVDCGFYYKEKVEAMEHYVSLLATDDVL